jgi:RsiW-degrading membrane proteinase PrsW (M82 family)
MSLEIEFEEPDYMKKQHTTQSKGISAALIKGGWAHDQASANKLLVFLTILIILATGIVYYLTVIRPKNVQQIRIPQTVLNRLSPELQSKIKASQQ